MSYVLESFRWFHVFFGIIWIGMLYYFNFVNGAFEKGLDASLKKPVVPALRGRALWWFRWGAMLTFLTGAVMFLILMHQSMASEEVGGWFYSKKGAALTGHWWITMGALFASVMWFNVWFVIWPRQQKLLTGIATGNKPADFDQMVNTATFASRMNTFLSIPMLAGMVGSQHPIFPAGDETWTLLGMVIVTGLGFGLAYHLIFKTAGVVGKEFANMVAPAAAAAAAAAPAAPAPAPPKA
ncbi:MAG: urate hydroxylase PuuD [Planctomycetes bacterium]|nr:urate hydroxylase PuuD [Planctomycetota bacterium]